MNILVHGQVVQPAPLSSATVNLVVHPVSNPAPEPGYSSTTKETSDDDKTLNPVAVTSSEETSYQG